MLRNKYNGYIGGNNHTVITDPKAYKVWSDMLIRVNENSKSKSYHNVLIDDQWYNFQIFAEWYNNYISLLNPVFLYSLDKDILQWNYSQKKYSPYTCCLIPEKLNSSLVGLHVKRTNHPDLPLSVMPNWNKYSSYIVENNKRIYLGSYNTPMEAFNVYKVRKENNIKSLAKYYFENGAILENIYESILNISIEPF